MLGTLLLEGLLQMKSLISATHIFANDHLSPCSRDHSSAIGLNIYPHKQTSGLTVAPIWLANLTLLTFGITEESVTLYRMVHLKFNNESFYLLPWMLHFILDALFLRSTWSLCRQKLANIPLADSVVRLGLVSMYSCCKSTFLQQLRQQVGWQRCLFFKRILTISPNGDCVLHVAAKNTCLDTTTRGFTCDGRQIHFADEI